MSRSSGGTIYFRDPHIENYRDPAPWIPGSDLRTEGRSPVRFRWPNKGDRDVARVRKGVQDEGFGLFVLRYPSRYPEYGGWKALVEAYYPRSIEPSYFEQNLAGYQRSDHKLGHLVACKVIEPSRTEDLDRVKEGRWRGGIPAQAINEMRDNNRAFNPDLRTESTSRQRAKEIWRDREEKQQRYLDSVAEDAYEAGREIEKFAKSKSFIPQEV